MTTKQTWQNKRCFTSYGRIIAIRNNLKDLSTHKEITPSESIQLTSSAKILDKLITTFNSDISKKLSFEHYCNKN